MLFPTIDRHSAPRPQCFTRFPSFTGCRRRVWFLFLRHRRQSPWATFDCQALVERARRALSLSYHAASRGWVLKHRFLYVLFYARALNCRNDRAATAHGCSSFLGSCSRVLSDNVMVAEPDLRDVPPLPLHIWPQVTHADAARSACSCCCCRGFGGLGLVQ